MQETGQPFDVALAVTRAGNLFTTHTAVSAGFDRFAPALIEQYLEAYAVRDLGIPLQELLALGRINPSDSSENFNMAYHLSRGARTVIRQNLAISLAVIAVLVVGALSGMLPLTLGVIGHEGSTVVVVLNSLRLLFHGERE